MRAIHVYGAWLAIGGASVAMALIACSSGSSGASCGPGTTLSNGECVVSPDAAPVDASIDDASSEDALGDVALDVDAGAQPPPNRCPTGVGPRMAELPTGDGHTYCIDTTEVTNAQFAAYFAATQGFIARDAGVPAACLDYTPPPPSPSDSPGCNYDPIGHPNNPVRCTAWCSAQAYCRWAGKRLCGRIGGGALSMAEAADPSASQWYRACGEAGRYRWTYGTTYQQGICVDSRSADSGTNVVASAPDCHPLHQPWAFVFDMNGNAAEWEDDCDSNLNCAVRGGGFADTDVLASCATARFFTIDTGGGAGFRCCAD